MPDPIPSERQIDTTIACHDGFDLDLASWNSEFPMSPAPTAGRDERIGSSLVLWDADYQRRAYTDQCGIERDGYVVRREIPIRIVESKPSPCMWTKAMYTGYRAEDESGRSYFLNWESYPSDSMTPEYYWHDGSHQFCDAMQAVNMRFPHVRPDGTKAIPAGAKFCESHHIHYSKECVYCCLKIPARKANEP